MAFYRGQQGSVKFDDASGTANAITSTRSWSLSLNKEALETTSLGATHSSSVGGIISGSGSVEVIYSQTAGETQSFLEQANATADTGTATFELYLDTSGSKKISFDGLVTGADYAATVGELETVTVNFVTSGTVTLAV
tara:strand:+ start:37 stop:450 length:414 start_codon:yes stop_codon:yes gene_type:complete